MACYECNNFGFITVVDENGKSHGERCKCVLEYDSILTQDRDGTMLRTHNSPEPTSSSEQA